MEKKNNGGPAFPFNRDSSYEQLTPEEEGMTLRDYFASHASESDITEHQKNIAEGYDMSRERARYEYADAMIIQRDK